METEYKWLQRLILIVGALALLSSASFTLTMFAWGLGKNTYIFLALYVLLISALTLVAFNIRLGYIAVCLIACSYSILLSESVIAYLLYNGGNLVLIPIVIVPFFLYLILVPLTIKRLMWGSARRTSFYRGAVALVLTFILYIAISLGFSNVHVNLYTDATISADGTVRIVCKPHFGDAREFYMTSQSKELAKLFKNQGEFYQGTWNAEIRGVGSVVVGKLQTFTITHINQVELQSPLEWKVSQLIGDTTFILP